MLSSNHGFIRQNRVSENKLGHYMIMLHVLAGFSALVLAAVAWSLYETGSLPLWKLIALPIGGLALPYIVGVVWAFLVAPPNLKQHWRASRSSTDDETNGS